MPKPVLLLDVDGVLAPFGGELPEGHRFLDIPDRYGDRDLQIYWNDANVDRLRRLLPIVELHWATGWEDHANDALLEHLGLEQALKVIYFDHKLENEGKGPAIEGAARKLSDLALYPGTDTWKIPWIRQWSELNPDRSFIWIDDEIFNDAKIWAGQREVETGVRILFIRTDPIVGLTDEHIEEIEKFVEALDTDPKPVLD